MESYRASRSKRVRTSLVFGGFLALSFLAEADGVIWGLRLVLAVLLGGQLYGHVYGYPRLTWTQEEIRFTGAYGKRLRLRLSDHGPVRGYSTHVKGRRAADLLALRPLAGGKTITLNISLLGLEEIEVKALAARINRASGYPEGVVDRQAQKDESTEITRGFAVIWMVMAFGFLGAVLYLTR